MSEIRVTVDATDARNEIDAVQNEALVATRQIITGFRRTLQLGTLTLQAVGIAIDEVFRLQIEALALTAESLLTIATVGLNPTSLLRLGQVALILLQINALKNGRIQTAAQLGAAEQGLDMILWSL